MKQIFKIMLYFLFACTSIFAQSITIHTDSGATTIDLKEIRDIRFYSFEDTVVDIDGNIYHTITIGNQVWMVENLKVTHYRNGDAIPNISDNSGWMSTTSGAYCDYANDPGNGDTYGRLYNWYTVQDPRNITPVGWHVPSNYEWSVLLAYLGGEAVAGGPLKDTGTIEEHTGLWHLPNTGATNNSGFTALPGGHRQSVNGDFVDLGYQTPIWSSTALNTVDAWYCLLYHSYIGVYFGASGGGRREGFSIRLIRD